MLFDKLQNSRNARHNNKRFYWPITNMPQLSGLNENSFCKTEKENSLIYSLTINENEAETKVKGLKVHLKLKYSHVLKKSWSMVWIC